MYENSRLGSIDLDDYTDEFEALLLEAKRIEEGEDDAPKGKEVDAEHQEVASAVAG